MLVLALLSLVSVALASGPCCPPRQWEENIGLTMGLYNVKNASRRQKSMIVLALLSLVSVALASGPCCPPRQWEGNIGLTMGLYNVKNASGHFIEGMMASSFDADKKLVVNKQKLMYDQQPVDQTIISDYKSGIMYILKGDGSCTANTLADNTLPFCIPDNATSGSFTNFGFGANLVNTENFEFKYGDYTVYLSVTSDTCVPVTEAIVGSDGKQSIMETLNYSSMKAGIADATVFDIPLACQQAAIQPPLPGLAGRRRSLFH